MELWQRRRSLGDLTVTKRRLYLDVRFWNDLCDAALGMNPTVEARECLAALRAAVADGSIVCPVEFNVVAEVHKQKLPNKQAATLALIDELSGRTVIVNARERMFLECLRFLQGLNAQNPPTAPPIEEVWTRPSYMVGHQMPDFPIPEAFPPTLVASLRDEFDSEIWEFGFEQLVKLTDGFSAHLDNSAETARMLNEAKRNPKHLFKSYEATYWSEIRGALDGYADVLGEVNLCLFHRAGGDVTTVRPEGRSNAALRIRKILYAGARKVGLKKTIPSLHVGATLYSRIQWDRRRLYKANDIYDFAHAEAALPYCNAFATDRSLASLLNSTGLSTEYSCEVFTDLRAISLWAQHESRPTG